MTGMVYYWKSLVRALFTLAAGAFVSTTDQAICEGESDITWDKFFIFDAETAGTRCRKDTGLTARLATYSCFTGQCPLSWGCY